MVVLYYDEEKDKFQNFFLEKNGKHLQVNGIVELSPERLLISTLEGLTMFDIPASRFVDDIFGTTMHKMVASALYRHDDQIYIGTPSDGLTYPSCICRWLAVGSGMLC